MSALGPLEFLVRTGGTWVIWLLLLASVLTVAVIVERALILVRERKAWERCRAELLPLLAKADPSAVGERAGKAGTIAPGILAEALAAPAANAGELEERLAAARIGGKYRLERRLWVLGTLGNNAPFIGLFGTVLGVIKAFADLAGSSQAGPEVVMAGLSEALIATAVGLLVAIPAVIAFNYLMKRAGEILGEVDAMGRLVLAALKARGR